MKLTPDQLETIREFIAKRGFMHTEVQIEILDHVATYIEERMTADPSLSFDSSLEQCHRDFGIMGFSSISDAVIAGLGKKYRQVFWTKFASVFGVKYIGLLILFSISMFFIFRALYGHLDAWLFSFMVVSHFTSPYIEYIFNKTPIPQIEYKKYLSFQIAYGYSYGLPVFYAIAAFTFRFIPETSRVQELDVRLVVLTSLAFLIIPYRSALRAVVKASKVDIELLEAAK